MEVIIQQPPTLDLNNYVKDDHPVKSKFDLQQDDNNNEIGSIDYNSTGNIVTNGYSYHDRKFNENEISVISDRINEIEVEKNIVLETNIKNLKMNENQERDKKEDLTQKNVPSTKVQEEEIPQITPREEEVHKKEEKHIEVEIINSEAETALPARPKIITSEPADCVVNVDSLKSDNLVSVPLTDYNNTPTVTHEKSSIVDVLTAEPEVSTTKTSTLTQGKRALVRVVLLVMLFTSILAAVVGLVWLYLGPIVAALLVVVAGSTYVVSSGIYRWFYVAYKTFPRDAKAGLAYLQILWTWHGYSRKNLSIGEIFLQNVQKHPHKVCFIYEDTQWTFAEVEEYSNKVANVFKAHGYRKGDTVALFMENKPEYICIWLGLSKLGVTVPLINTNLRATSLLHSITVASCTAIIFGSELHEALQEIAGKLDSKVALYELFVSNQVRPTSELKERNLNALLSDASTALPQTTDEVGFNDTLLYIYTSGTTGLPKAAVITHSRFCFIAAGIHFVGRFRSEDVLYTPLPLYHTAGGVMSIGQALLFGLTVVVRKKFSASAYFPDCRKYDCTIAQYIGEMCRYILAVPSKEDDKKHKLRVIYGNGLRPQIWQDFIDRFGIAQVTEFYGATEGNANIVNVDSRVGAIGFVSRIAPALYPISIIRVDESGEPLRGPDGLCMSTKPGEPGAFIGKINPNNPTRAFLGYVDKKASEKKIIRDVFQKGDQAFLSGDILVADELGYLFFKDRTGDTFRWKGENVSTSEVEGIVSNLISYKDACVYGVEIHGQEGRAGMAAIHDPDNAVNLTDFANGLKKELPVYARPQILRILEKVDMTGTYKLRKVDLQAEGYDPNKISDQLFYLSAQGFYQPLTKEAFEQINTGKIRF